VYNSAQQKIDDSAADWDFAPQDRVRGEINIDMDGDLSNMMDSMAFENLEDGSSDDDQEMACKVLLDVDFQVNFDRVFDALARSHLPLDLRPLLGLWPLILPLIPNPFHWRLTHRGLADRAMHPEPPPIRLLLKFQFQLPTMAVHLAP
jgi:hypothetical protein